VAQLYFYFSAMNAGKSTSLLQSAYNYHERGMTTKLYTAAIDDRYGVGKISSRIGLSEEAATFGSDTDFWLELNKSVNEAPINCIFIDEAQFLTKAQVLQLARVTDELDVPVLCYGLRSDYQGEPFEGSIYLLVLADKLSEIKTVCHCGRKATMVLRVNAEGQPVLEGEQIEIGGDSRYSSVCRKHFFEAKRA
jgi:thymidine kinase